MKHPVDILNSNREKLCYIVYHTRLDATDKMHLQQSELFRKLSEEFGEIDNNTCVVVRMSLAIDFKFGSYSLVSDLTKLITSDQVIQIIPLTQILRLDELPYFVKCDDNTYTNKYPSEDAEKKILAFVQHITDFFQ